MDYFHRSTGAPGSDLPRDASSGVGPGYTRGKDCAGLALTPSNYSNTLKAHCGFISIDLMARQTPTSSKNVCCGSQRSIDNSTFCNYFAHVSGAHLRCYSACAVPRGAARCQKKRVRAAFQRGSRKLIVDLFLLIRWRASRRPRQKMSAVDPSVA